MKSEINKKMEKRLAWIDLEDTRQVTQLSEYLSKTYSKWSIPSDRRPSFFEVNPKKYMTQFVEDVKYCTENASTRENCRNLKAAWLAWDKRDKNKKNPKICEGSYTISVKARAELEKLAKKETNNNFSSVIEYLLINAKEIDQLQKQLKKALKDRTYNRRLDLNFFSTLFSSDHVKDQANLITQEQNTTINNLKKQFSNLQKTANKTEKEKQNLNNTTDDLTNKLNKMIEENAKLKKRTTEMEKDLNEFLNSDD